MAIHVLRHESRVLSDNPCGDPAGRDVWVYTPPGYETSGAPYPVLWCLAGFTGTGVGAVSGNPWSPGLPDRLDRLIGAGACSPVVVAFPDCFTRWGGSQYLNSSATGRYEDYLCDELLPFVDASFRTSVRGVFGKSSGGYGAVRLAMRRPGLFEAVACHSGDMGFAFCYPPDFARAAAAFGRAGSVGAWVEAFESREKKRGDDFPVINAFGMAAAYSPDPDRPFGVGLPFDIDTAELRADVWQRWLAHDPVRMVEDGACAAALRGLRLLFLDCGTRDEYQLDRGLRRFTSRLTELGIAHELEEFADDHRSLSYRYDRSIPKLAEALHR